MPQPTVTRRRAQPMRPIRPDEFGYDQGRHLLWRAGFGGTPAQVQTLVRWGPEEAVGYLLDVEKVPFESPDADLFDRDIIRPPTAAERAQAAEARRRRDEDALARIRAARQEAQRTDRRQIRDVQRWWLTRMIETPRPLEEKMTLFWHGHFATSYRTIENSYHMYLQNQLFRRHALGSYAELMYQIIRDPAMIAYLDNNDSRRDRPNENLARELMELFSLGVGAYGEQDIKEGARALTGYTFRDDAFYFDERNHDPNPKRILGRSGPMDGDGFVSAILEHPACGRFMARKLYRYFVADLPDRDDDIDPETREVLDRMASTFRRNRYQIRPVLRELMLSEHFYDDRIMAQQIKSPAQLVVGAVRSLLVPVRDLGVLLEAMDLMGQNLMMPPSVKGWDGGRAWINTSTLFVRQNTLSFLLTGRKPGGYDALAAQETYDPQPALAELERASPGALRDPDRLIDYLLRFMLGRAPDHAQRTLHEFVRANGNDISTDMTIGLMLLITAMPEYQLC
ncbi:MAG: DUF1800 family protein [Phycisphaerales bacterium JB039]